MKRLFIIGFALAMASIGFAQAPNWYDAKSRADRYPADLYFSGFAMTKLNKSDDLEKALESVKAAARVEAVSTIQVRVQALKKDYSLSESSTNGKKALDEFYQRYESTTRLITDMEIPGLNIESYQDGNTLAAFAYVSRQDLQRQLEKQISMALARIEVQLDNASELSRNGQKSEARKRIDALSENFTDIERNQALLLTIDPQADAISLQLNETNDLAKRRNQMLVDLQNGIYLYIACSADMFGKQYTELLPLIQGELSPIGCTFVSAPADADWVISINAPAREYNKTAYGEVSTYFAYVDATISITKAATNQCVHTSTLSEKGGHTHNFEQAARTAYRDIAPKISALIKDYLSQY